MTETLIFVALGVTLIAVLVFLLWRPEPQTGDQPIASEALDQRAEELVERIFGDEDWQFLKSRVPHHLQRSFLREHREIAFAWLALVRSRARAAMRHHLVHARNARTLEPALEFRVTVNYFAFQLTCALLAVVLWLRAPVALRSMVRRAERLGHAVHSLVEIPGEHRVPTAATRP